jgi:diguanylate cyclase
MNRVVLDLFFSFGTLLLGAAFAGAASWWYFHRRTKVATQREARRAAQVLVRLQDIATRVAFDVDAHNEQVEQISETLASADSHEPKMIIDVVAKLVEANQQMHDKLVSTEDKLRAQAVEIQTHATEARTDALTLLVNRRAFDDELMRRCAEFTRQRRNFSLVMGDVDKFKDFNDRHGHVAGDEVLRDVAKVLRRKTREMDLVARYGGEEFAMILPGTALCDAETVALRACDGIAKAPFNHEDNDLRVTMSFGVAEVLDADNATTLVERADRALYGAKEDGRNCVYRHDGTAIQRSVASRTKALSGPQTDRAAGNPTIPVAAIDSSRTASSQLDRAAETDACLSEEDVDGGSGLPNRSNFCQQVRYRTAEWKRGGPTFSIALIEVNELDAAGRSTGGARETTIAATTKFLAATIREMDVVGRYAPGCFALMVPTATLANAIRVTERLHEGFALFNAAAGENGPRLGLSIGVVQIQDEDDSISVLKRAEAALDASVRQGGDCVYCHDGERSAPVAEMMESLENLS